MPKYLIILALLTTHLAAIASDPTLETDGSLMLQEVEAGETDYSAMLQLQAGTGIAPIFSLESAGIISSVGDSPIVTYTPSSGTVEISKLISDGRNYRVTLRELDQGRYQLTHLAPSGEISLMYLITTPALTFNGQGTYGDRSVGNHFVMDAASAQISEFADRPFRIARRYEGGLSAFAGFYQESDFESDHPNATFTAIDASGEQVYTIFEIGDVFVFEDKFIITVQEILGENSLPLAGTYSSGNFVVDSIFGWLDPRKALIAGCEWALKKVIGGGMKFFLGDSCGGALVEFEASCNGALDLETAGDGALVCGAAGAAMESACLNGTLDALDASDVASNACGKL